MSAKPADAVEHNNVLAPSMEQLKRVLDLAHARLQEVEEDGQWIDYEEDDDAYAAVSLWVGWLQGLTIPQRLQIAADALTMAGECVPMLTLSTAHVSAGTGKWLDELGEGWGSCPAICVYAKGEFGWWIHHLPAFGPTAALPDDLQPLIQYCFDRGIEWLCLDRDGPEDAQFPLYEW